MTVYPVQFDQCYCGRLSQILFPAFPGMAPDQRGNGTLEPVGTHLIPGAK
jgi:hypothetical protein